MENFEKNVMDCLSKNGLSIHDRKQENKVAQCILSLYNKINNTNFKSKAPKIVIMKIDLRDHNKQASA